MGSMDFSADEKAGILRVAREAIERWLRGAPSAPIDPHDVEPALCERAGCFISLHRCADHGLRGCIGRLDAEAPLYVMLQRTARSVLRDPRFADHPITLNELEQLSIEISVLSPLKPAANPLDFEPLTHGIYLVVDGQSGCFLPQVARETGWGREQLLDRLCGEKLGIDPGGWCRTDAKLWTFTVAVIGPEPFRLPA